MKYIFTTVVAALLIVASLSASASDVIDSTAALAGVKTGEITLMDVRSPREWRETGLPEGAKAITIHGPDGMAGFVAGATRAVKGKKDQPIALICARGWRSHRAANALREAGFTKIINVREGMLGNPFDGPGWLDRKLPTQPCRNC
jgi:rhodanese-related sulfurtransferase